MADTGMSNLRRQTAHVAMTSKEKQGLNAIKCMCQRFGTPEITSGYFNFCRQVACVTVLLHKRPN
jgi:hypothetical protein